MGCEFSYVPSDIPAYNSSSPNMFGRFPWYYELVSRGRALYVNLPGQFFCGVSLPWDKGINGFLTNRLIVLRPEVNGSLDGFLTFTKELAKQSNYPLVLKHVQSELAERLINHGFRYYGYNEGWDDSAREDDQTFDEVVINLEETLKHPPALQRTRSRTNQQSLEFILSPFPTMAIPIGHEVEAASSRLKQHDAASTSVDLFVGNRLKRIESKEMECSKVRNQCKDDVLCVFYKWLKRFHQRHPWAVDEDFLNFHLSTFETLVANELITIIFVHNKLDEPVGVFSLAKTSGLQADVVFSFIAEEEGDFQRLAYREIFREVNKMGFRHMNLGGSEMESLFKFKRSLGVFTLIQSRHIVLDLTTC